MGKLFSVYNTIIGIRLFLGFIFFTSGMAKLYFEHRFPGIIGPVWLEERLAEYQLGLYARFIAFSQILIGLLLLSQRFATMGAVMLVPMLVNILMITISLNWRGTPYVLAFLFLLNVLLLIYDFHKLKFIFVENPQELSGKYNKRKNPGNDMIWAIALGIILGSIPLSFYNVYWSYGMVFLGMLLFVYCQLSDKS